MANQGMKFLSGLVLGSLLLAGCVAPPAAPGAAPAESAGEKVKITMWQDAESSADCLIDVAVKSFNEENDDVEVVVERKANMIDAVRPALAAGAGPDIVPTHGPAFVA